MNKKKTILLLLIISSIISISACKLNMESAMSVGMDLYQLRQQNEIDGKPHIEDVVNDGGSSE